MLSTWQTLNNLALLSGSHVRLFVAAGCHVNLGAGSLFPQNDMTTATLSKPLPRTGNVEIGSWLCNGSINPLIRDYRKLEQHAKEDLNKALWYCAIELEVYFHEKAHSQEEIAAMSPQLKAGLFYHWYQVKHAPSWKRRPQIVPGIFTPAQFLAKHGNLDCRAKCDDFSDLCAALNLVQSFNEFNAPAVAREFDRFNLSRYFLQDNPNTGRDAWEYYLGWEGTLAIYISAVFHYPLFVLDRAWEHWTQCDRETFGDMVKALARATKADECGRAGTSDTIVTWRLWWD